VRVDKPVNMKTAIVCLSVIGLLVQVPRNAVSAQNAIRGSMAYGPFNGDTAVSCGLFTGADRERKQVYEWWAYGFVSGVGFAYSRQNISLAPTDTGGIDGWITKYCADHPLDTLIKATFVLADELRTRGRAH
jgi:hypothetical protein